QTMGAGRTDTGVHAKEMYVHFDWAPEQGSGVENLDQLVQEGDEKGKVTNLEVIELGKRGQLR
ncbi:hypothetical protein N9X97_04525, partial [Schleiferiaceae bacterium]|nr:hypothetical protein [Schleiferiaceae bacterium]